MMKSEPSISDLIGKRLAIVGRAADMMTLQFGTVRPHKSGKGSVGELSLHIQCPWRLDDAEGTVCGSADLHVYAGDRPEPDDWTYADGDSLQDMQFHRLFGDRDPTKRWQVTGDDFTARSATCDVLFGDVSIRFSGGHLLSIFPSGCSIECWRLFRSGDAVHLVFPAGQA